MAMQFQKRVYDTHPSLEFHVRIDPEDPQHPDDPWVYCDKVFLAVPGSPPVELDDPEGRHQTVLDINRLKNRAMADAIEELPAKYKKAELDADGQPTGRMIVKAAHEPDWEWDGGTIALKLPGLTKAEKAAIEAKIRAKRGPNLRTK